MSEGSVLLEQGSALLSILLMGITAALLLFRFFRVLKGEESCSGITCRKTAERKDLILVFLLAVLSRILIYLFAYLLCRGLNFSTGSFADTFRPLWEHWDTQHYLGIAKDGYVAEGTERLRLVFFPLYPLLIRAVSHLTGAGEFYSGILISLVCTGFAASLLYELCFSYGGKPVSCEACAFFLLNPLSVFLCCCYTEALFLCMTLAAWVSSRKGKPWISAVFGGLAAFTRMPGIVCMGIPLLNLIGRIGARRAKPADVLKCAAQMAVVFSGIGLYWLINYRVTGSCWTYLVYQKENWFQQAGTFWNSTANTVHYFLISKGSSDWFWTWGFQLICMFLIYFLMISGQKELPFDLSAYCYVYILVVLCPTWLLSGARYLYAMAPLPLLFAKCPQNRFLRRGLLVLMGLLLPVWIFGYTLAVEVL